MAKVRLKSPSMKGFSSYMGVTKFENGVSVDHVTEREAQLLGSITSVEYVDDEGNAIGNAGMAQVQVDNRSTPAPVELKKLMGAETFDTKEEQHVPDVKVEIKPEPKEEADAEAEKLEAEVEAHEEEINAKAEEDTPVYTREELEAAADEGGIHALREIGAKRGVKSNSIEDLIAKILKAQG